MSATTADAVIIGTGVHGAGAGYFLARSGWRVVLVEAGEAGGGTSSATNANLALHNRDPAHPDFGLAVATVESYAALTEELGAELEFRRCGGVMLADDEATLAALEARASRQRQAGLRIEVMDGRALRRLDPGLAADLPGGLYCPDSAWVNPLLVVRACLSAIQRRGGQIWTQTPATGIRVERGRVVEVQTSRGPIATRLVVDAAGASAGAVARMAGVPFDITPVWGQLVVTEPVPARAVGMWNEGAVVLHRPDDTGYAVRFLATRVPSGQLLIGRCELHGEGRRRVVPGAVAPVLRRAARFLPALRELRVLRIFAGIRPYSPDDRAAIGLVPTPEGFALLAGFGDRGIGLGGAARFLAQLLCGQRPSLPLGPYDPGRFYRPGGRPEAPPVGAVPLGPHRGVTERSHGGGLA